MGGNSASSGRGGALGYKEGRQQWGRWQGAGLRVQGTASLKTAAFEQFLLLLKAFFSLRGFVASAGEGSRQPQAYCATAAAAAATLVTTASRSCAAAAAALAACRASQGSARM